MTAYMLHIAPAVPEAPQVVELLDEIEGIVRSFGGRYHVRLRQFTEIEGSVDGERISLIEFPSISDLVAFHQSDEYQPYAAVRVERRGGALLAFESDNR